MSFAIGRLCSMLGRGAASLTTFVRSRRQVSMSPPENRTETIWILVQTKIRTQVDSFNLLVVRQFPWSATPKHDAVVNDIGAVRYL